MGIFMIGVVYEPLLELGTSEQCLPVVSSTNVPLDPSPVPPIERDALTESCFFCVAPHSFANFNRDGRLL